MSNEVTLTPIEEADLERLVQMLGDPASTGEFEWFGFQMDRAKEFERRWQQDGLIGGEQSFLAIKLSDGACAGIVDWRPIARTGNYEIGIALFAEHRGHGIGTEAQRLLVDYLFNTTPVHRLQAGTETDNIAEQRALERVGFQREGAQCGHHFRDGAWRDGIMYGLLRSDPRP